MEFYRFFSVWIIVILLSGVKGNENIEVLIEKVNILEKGIKILSDKMLTDKDDLLNKQEMNILKMKTDLKKTIRRYITESLSDILRDESVEKLIQSQVLSEMRHLKRANHQMRRELHQMRTSLVRVEEDNKVYRDGLQRGERQNTETSQIVVKSELLTSELARHDRQIMELNHELRHTKDSCELSSKAFNKEINQLRNLSTLLKSENLTNKLARYDRQINELNLTLRIQTDSCKSRNYTINKEPDSALIKIQTTSVSPTTSAAVPRAITTSKPSTERRRILLVPVGRGALLQMQQFNINTNSFDKYPHLSLKYCLSALYISKMKSLLISLSSPSRIIISELNTSKTKTIKRNVITIGMAADEERGIVFLTTYNSTTSIRRMTLHGENLTTLVDLNYGMFVGAIVINPTIKTIYVCNYLKLFKVFYDGTGLRTLDTGYGIYGVTLDITKGLLYYSKEKKLMKMPLDEVITSEVTGFNFNIWNLIFYQNKVYYSSYNKLPGVLGVVDVGNNSVSRTLQTVNLFGVGTYSICLIP